MTRMKNVFVAAALIAAPASSAFAGDDAAAAGETGGTDGTATPAPASTEGSGGSVSASASTAHGSAILDRSLTLGAGKLAFQADVGIVNFGDTSEGLAIGAGYGVNDKITVGATYGFTLNEFEIKGPLTLYGNYNITDNGKLSIAGGVDFAVNPGTDPTGIAIDAGLAVRYKITPKLAVYTGNPYAPGPAGSVGASIPGLTGQHLHLGLDDGGIKTFSIPVGVAFQATPQLYLHADTTVAIIRLDDPGMGNRVISYGDVFPFAVGGWFNVNPNLDVGASFNTDLEGVGDYWGILVGGRYYL